MNAEVLEKILAYIDEHICERIGLAEVASLAGYSPFYFSKLFSEVMGMPITGYIRIRKLQYALHSLLEGKTVLEVSCMYAFESHEGFTRSFTRLFGTVPSRVKKYLASYQVPEYRVPEMEGRIHMESHNEDLSENMHQLIFEVLKMSLEEAAARYCTEIVVTLQEDGSVKVEDDGRGIPLSDNGEKNQEILQRIFAGHPISRMEYSQMGDFKVSGLQTVNSLCECMHIKVYRDGRCFRQDYVRGIVQHDVYIAESEKTRGMELIFKPDSAIFGKLDFSRERIRAWVRKNGVEDFVKMKL